MRLSDDIKYIKGIGEARAKLFSRIGIHTVSDLISHIPRSYEDRSQIKKIAELTHGDTVCVEASLADGIKTFRTSGRRTVAKTTVSDGSDIMRLTWFNSPYINQTLSGGGVFTFYGKAELRGRFFEMVNPVVERSSGGGRKTGLIVPVYSTTGGLTQQHIRNAVCTALSELNEEIPETIPESIRKKYKLMPVGEAFSKTHMPKSESEFHEAAKRLAFEELFTLQLGIACIGDERKLYRAPAISNVKCVLELAEALPFKLTAAQKRVINEVCADIRKNVPMNRLVQGDVGSGKTMVAAAAMFAAVKSGFQAALMVPTEILAMQHYKNLSGLFEKFGFETVLLCGGMSAADKRIANEKISCGAANVIIGTHALITDKACFKNLALVITDEQHRFGVKQRSVLSAKGINAHTLVMTATPIPRTLSLIIYGDLDISVIDELPPGRKAIKTYSVSEKMRSRVYNHLAKSIESGRQVYIVCPLVEDSEVLTAKSVTMYVEELKKSELSKFRIGVIHGRLKSKEKDAVMEAFKSGDIDILVSTTVIEVGVDVPNASVMVVENAERFGLSQLHQLRGRIGRGEHCSECILFCETDGKIAKERMKVMCSTNDGFKIAEKDLELRGPGEFFGLRQHGLPELKFANLALDMDILAVAKKAAAELLEADPTLSMPQQHALREHIRSKFSEVGASGILN